MSHLEIPINDPRITTHYPLSETRFHKLIVFLARGLFRLLMELRVNGVENLPGTGPVVICANHLVMFDVFPLQLALPRMIYFMGKAELFQNKINHEIFRQLGGFPVFRGERDTWAINHSKKILLSGQIVAMFPEGTRSKGKGLALARPGAAKLAIELGCPVVVISVNGIQNVLRTFPKKTIVEVNIAPQIFAERSDSPLSLTDKIMYTMAENLPIELRGVYKKN